VNEPLIDDQIRTILQKLEVAGEAEAILLTGELRSSLQKHAELLRRMAAQKLSPEESVNRPIA